MDKYEIITSNRQQLTAAEPQAITTGTREICTALFMEFAAWINRSEKTTRTYIKNLKQFLAWLRYVGITAPARADILSYKEWLAVEHEAISLAPECAAGWQYRTDAGGRPLLVTYTANTQRHYLRSVCQFFTWAADFGYYPNIARNIHGPKLDRNAAHQREALPLTAVEKIERSIAAHAEQRQAAAADAAKDKAGKMQRSTEQGKRLYAMYMLAVNAGLRTIEISRAKIKDLETKDGQAWLYVWGKGHAAADKKQPLAPEVMDAIKDYLAARTDKPTGNSPLFVSTGNRSGGKAIATTTISTMLKKAMQEAGFDSERLTAHSLRHTAATNVLGVTNNNIYETQNYVRHSDPRTTEIYIHETAETEKATAGIAQQLYNRYHGIKTTARESLESIIAAMNPAQLAKLESIAAAIA